MLRNLENLPDLSGSTDEDAAIFITNFVATVIPNSSTKLSLLPDGYPETGEIEVTIRSYRDKNIGCKESAIKAVETGCGNCEEMAYAGALILRTAGFKGNLVIGQCGINHRFLFVGDFIADPWAQVFCHNSEWRGVINGYGGSIKKGILRGRIVSSTSEELEDEDLDRIETISLTWHVQPQSKLDKINSNFESSSVLFSSDKNLTSSEINLLLAPSTLASNNKY